jgi:hypothetical protein
MTSPQLHSIEYDKALLPPSAFERLAVKWPQTSRDYFSVLKTLDATPFAWRKRLSDLADGYTFRGSLLRFVSVGIVHCYRRS